MTRILRLYRAAYGGLPRRVWLLCGVALVNRAGTMVLPFLALWLTEHRGLSASAAGGLIAAYGAGGMAGSYLGGWLCDRIGSTRAQQASLVGSGVAYLALAGLRAPIAIALVSALLGVIAEAYRPAVMTAVSEAAPTACRGRAFALLRLAVNVGMGIGPGLGGLLALAGYVWLFVVDALTAWLAALILLRLAWREAPPVDPGGPMLRAGSPETDGLPATHRGSPWSDGPFLMLMLFVLGMACVFFQVFSTLPLTLREGYGLREHHIGGLFSFNALLIVVFEMLVIVWAERRDSMMLVGAGAFLICAGLGMMPLGSSLGFAMLTVTVWTLGEMLALPLLNVVIVARAAPSHRGRYMGVYTMTFNGAFVLAPAAGSQIYERLGATSLWIVVAALAPVLWLVAIALRGPLERGTAVEGRAQKKVGGPAD